MSHILRKLLKNRFLPFDIIFMTMVCKIVAPLQRRPAHRNQHASCHRTMSPHVSFVSTHVYLMSCGDCRQNYLSDYIPLILLLQFIDPWLYLWTTKTIPKIKRNFFAYFSSMHWRLVGFRTFFSGRSRRFLQIIQPPIWTQTEHHRGISHFRQFPLKSEKLSSASLSHATHPNPP